MDFSDGCGGGDVGGVANKTGPLVSRTATKRTGGHHTHENGSVMTTDHRTLGCRVSIERDDAGWDGFLGGVPGKGTSRER